MGAICEEELMKWEKIKGAGSAREEKILVLVRLKPLSEKEIAKNEVSDWECINRTSILFRNSLQERSMFPTAYTFDRVFGGDCSTRLVYEEGAKEIALSVVSGINSSIFAYGQTSSGKTYTMIGITEYTVADIYDYIKRHEERAFVLKFSAMEIYNEAVRDLLSTDNMPLRLLDDPEKGTVVEKLTEETLRDWRHLKELLSLCEAQRQTGETSLNETSSRSHQILRLTIESSAREFLGKDKSTTLAASVNFVDLAGSERASQALSVGQRLKEGCHINRSLLTLGTVIRKLSKGRHGHVNYRDSKLTRILQPCLGGNARTAIICTLSPAQSHVEQSRNTLLFASCAKEVSTNAQVNVVMSDKALVKHLQKELANLEIELRTHIPTSDYVALLRKKDVQIEKLEKDVRELTKQRDLAQSQIEKLQLMVRNDQDSRQWDELGYYPKWQGGSSWEDQCSVSKSSGLADQSSIRNNRNNKVPNRQILKNDDDNSLYDEVSSSNISKLLRSVPCQHGEEFPLRSAQDFDDICKEVRCIEMDESSKNKIMKSHIISNGENEARITLERKIQGLQKTINSLVSPYADGQSMWNMEAYMSSSRSLNLTRSRSCRANLMIGSSSPGFEMEGQSESTPLNSFEKKFPVRPEGLRRKLRSLNFGDNIASLSRYDSQTSVGTAFTEGSRVENNKTSGDEDIPSVGTFVAGLKEMAKLQYETQAFDDQVQEMELKAELGTPEWPLEFERQQRSILELWEICNVSLVHRTYFFLLFKGDPMDSIYMEVEIRRLSFLNETFSKGNPAVEDGRTLTPGSSVKALRREREMLSRLMYKRFSDEERNKIYIKWGISLDSKRRRFQLVHRLWSDAKDMNHIKESAAIVAKLVRFLEQGQALKEMFGLSFTPLHMSRRSSGWKHGMASLL